LVCSKYHLSLINLTPELNVAIIKKPLLANHYILFDLVNTSPYAYALVSYSKAT